MKKLLKRIALTLVILIVLFVGLVFVATVLHDHNYQTPKSDGSTQVKEPITPDGVFLAINQERSKNSLPQFKRNPKLDESSTLKCKDMVAGAYYDHKNPTTGKDGYSYVQDVGVSASWTSENLNQGTFNGPKDVVDSWMGSEAHKASILDPKFTEIGFAVCGTQPDGTATVVQHKIEPYVAPPTPQVQYQPQYRNQSVNCTHYPSIGTLPARTSCY